MHVSPSIATLFLAPAAPAHPVLQLLRSLKANRALLWSFVGRDLKSRYVGSSLGFFWSVVYPIMSLAVYLLVFQIILKMPWDPDKSSQEVVLLMLVAIVSWTAFAESISRSTNILVDNQNLIQKVVFPSEVLPAYVTISAIVNMMIALPIVLLALLYAKLNPTDDPPEYGRSFDGASLVHAIWFHRPGRFDDWVLHDFRGHGLTGARGLAVGEVFSQTGVHLATIAQEVLLREKTR